MINNLKYTSLISNIEITFFSERMIVIRNAKNTE